MGCSESKQNEDISLKDYKLDLYNIELPPVKENKYVVECLSLIKYMSMDNILQSKITFNGNNIQICYIEYIYKSEFIKTYQKVLLKEIINIDEEELLGLVKKLPPKPRDPFLEEKLIKDDKNYQELLLNDRMKMLLKKNAEKYYFKVYHKLKEKKRKRINHRILYCKSHNTTELIFCFCKIGSIGLEYLCTKIQIFKNITSLNLQLNKITFDGFICFTEVIKYLPNISELLLDYNSISSNQFSGLFSCFKFLPKLVIFGISENPIGDIGVISLSENILFTPNITYLNIENCKITDLSFESLCRKLYCIKELEELDVGYKGVNCFINNCNSVYKLKYIWLNDNNIQKQKEIERRIRKNHKNKKLKIFISISKNN